ncbi:MAG: menaquinone biosynthesis protein [Planctomycetes bacterium]|nr:menaquinone biosynthesis protein [Planctomycetota bacterium]
MKLLYFGRARIGAVAYLNSKPLIEGLSALAPEAELQLDYPSRLADRLAAGELDVALVPSFELFGNSDYEVVSDACVATRGAVLSVKLYSRVPPVEIRRLALDEGSRTSAALVQILLAERYGVRPQTEPLPLGAGVGDSTADAVLVIGDRAMHEPAERFHAVWDLGSEWLDWTGLPFVFAVWAGRRESAGGKLDEALAAARDHGLEHIGRIARREARSLGIPETVAREYLTQNLHFHLGPAEQRGLKLFHELAVRLGFAPRGVELVFRSCAAV